MESSLFEVRSLVSFLKNYGSYRFARSRWKPASTDYKRIYHYHIRKAAGTALNYSFLESGGECPSWIFEGLVKHRTIVSENGRVFVGWNKWMIEKGYYFFAFSHLPKHKLTLPEGTFKLTVFRDPVERLFSHYRMIKSFEERGIRHPFLKKEANWVRGGFEGFLEQTPREHLCRQLYMFSENRSVVEALGELSKLNYWFFSDNYQEGIANLSCYLGIELKQKRENVSESSLVISTSEREAAKKVLADEYRFIEQARGLWDKRFK